MKVYLTLNVGPQHYKIFGRKVTVAQRIRITPCHRGGDKASLTRIEIAARQAAPATDAFRFNRV